MQASLNIKETHQFLKKWKLLNRISRSFNKSEIHYDFVELLEDSHKYLSVLSLRTLTFE